MGLIRRAYATWVASIRHVAFRQKMPILRYSYSSGLDPSDLELHLPTIRIAIDYATNFDYELAVEQPTPEAVPLLSQGEILLNCETPALDEKDVHIRNRSETLGTWYQVFLILTITILAGLGGFTLGLFTADYRNTIPEWTHSLSRVEIGWAKQTFHYNKSFGAAPSADEATEEAWDTIVPQGQGFVRYPANSPNISTVSVVHQLHCLYSIRRAYFSAASSQRQGKEYHGPSHMRHCFDYLRQSLMCAADSSLEPPHPYLPGATGWGFPRRCQSYDELKAWAELWRANDRHGFREGHFPSKPGLGDGHEP